MLCGDFNARCGSDADYIEGVDDIEPRSIVDYCKNSYYDIFIDFLINRNCIVLNGRGKGSNDYTAISSTSKGVAVVDMNDITAKCSNLGVTELHEQFCVIIIEAMSKSLMSRKIILGERLKLQIRYKPWWSDILSY